MSSLFLWIFIIVALGFVAWLSYLNLKRLRKARLEKPSCGNPGTVHRKGPEVRYKYRSDCVEDVLEEAVEAMEDKIPTSTSLTEEPTYTSALRGYAEEVGRSVGVEPKTPSYSFSSSESLVSSSDSGDSGGSYSDD